jgi:type II secretory pathway pseudopilin PulG
MSAPATFIPCRRLSSQRSGYKSSSGFTILEVAFAGAVLALAITTSLTAMQRAFGALDTARKITLAGQIMQSQLERMRLENWATIASYTGTTDITGTIESNFASSAAITRTFTLSRTVSEVHTGMKQIVLTTTWTTHDGRALSRSYTTYYGKHGLYDYFYNSF